jgi:hypothetical protein
VSAPPPDPTRPTGPDREPTHLPAGDSPWGLPPESDTGGWTPYSGSPTPTAPQAHQHTPTAPYGSPPGPPGPPRRGGTNPALVVGLVAAAIVIVIGLVTGGVLISRSGDDDTAGGDGDPTSAPPSTEATSEPTDEPTDEPTSEMPSSEPPVEPTEPTTPSESPEEPAVPASGNFKYQEFGGDWDFKFGGVSLFATFKKGWNYKSCKPVEATAGSLAELGCRRAASWTYRALDGHLALTHIVLTMRDGSSAEKAASGGIVADDWKVDPGGWLEGAAGGTWEADAQGNFVVLTVETHEKPVRKAKADEFRSYANSDITAALIFRD